MALLMSKRYTSSMLKGFRRYHQGLLRQGETSSDLLRSLEIQQIAWPWACALLGLVGVLMAAELFGGTVGRIATNFVAPLIGIPILVGLFYAIGTYAYAALRADMVRRKEPRSEPQ